MEKREMVRKRWIEVVSQFRASQMTQPAFCQREGVGLAALRYWLARVDRLPAVPASEAHVRFVPLAVSATHTPERSHKIDIKLGLVRLRVATGTDPDYVVRLLHVLHKTPLPC